MDKGDAMVKHSLGARVDDMYEIQLLATNPAAQGRGLGSALVQYILSFWCIRKPGRELSCWSWPRVSLVLDTPAEIHICLNIKPWTTINMYRATFRASRQLATPSQRCLSSVAAFRSSALSTFRKPLAITTHRRAYAMAAEDTNKGVV